MSLRRRGALAAVAVAAALSLAACQGSSGGDTAKGNGDSAQQNVATGGKDFGKAGDKTASFGTDAKPGQFPRTITMAMGKVTIPKRPERVVVLDLGELDNVVSLGVKPVGWAATQAGQGIPDYLKKGAGHPKLVGTIDQLNLEAIADLHPDLILGSQLRAASQYKNLSKIAPTVFSIRPGYTWKSNYLLNAAALDKTAEAKQELGVYDQKVAALKKALGPHEPTVSMVRYMPGRLRLYGQDSFIGTILKDVGLPRPKNQQENELAIEISPEKIDEANADWIFTGTYGDPKKTDEATAQSNPLWKNLPAVKDGHAKTVDDNTWYLGLGVTAAYSVLDDLHRYLVG